MNEQMYRCVCVFSCTITVIIQAKISIKNSVLIQTVYMCLRSKGEATKKKLKLCMGKVFFFFVFFYNVSDSVSDQR